MSKHADLPRGSHGSHESHDRDARQQKGGPRRRLLFLTLIAISTITWKYHHHLYADPTIPLKSSDCGKFPLSTLESLLLSEPDGSHAAEWSRYYTSQSHFPGEGKEQGLWTKKKWEGFGIPETEIIKYNATISQPLLQRLALINASDASVIYEAKLMEELPDDDPSEIKTPAFHGGSASGNVTAQFVYANFGRPQDYDDLERNHVDVKGKIAIVKYGMVWRGDKMRAAAERGLVGILTYTDPQQDGDVTEGNGYKPYPDGPARPDTCIERGAIGAIRNASAGNPAVPGLSIPSIPVSYGDIVPILKVLHGRGPKAADLGSDWHRGGLYYKGVEYHVGPSPPNMVLNLNNQMAFPNKNVYQTFGTIPGAIDDEVIILGNHRDSWGPGAGDSVSGAAALMEVVRSFAAAYKKGWRPRRTLIFVSWDGAETGTVGSEPWIRQHLPWLKKTTVAYLNVVVAAGGPQFQVKATPLLRRVIHRATKKVASPEGGTVFDRWGGDIIAAGGGDAIPFLATACVSTTDLSFGALYWPYHSNFDTFAWMNTTGDPGWKYHVATTRIWSLMAAYLSEIPVLQFRAADYAVAMRKYVQRLRESIPDSVKHFDLGPLEDAIAEFEKASERFDAYASSILKPPAPAETESETTQTQTETQRTTTTAAAGGSPTIRQVNQKYIQLERQFCHNGAHLIYEFSAFYTDPPEFPHLYRSLASGDLEEARKWMELIQSRIRDAAELVKL
ncbi:hypothetical protein QBC43DRAFT_303223 [Cladorrhinum sp. PSN259]|nr:hypothetical protein QBC43DRAFT_303223 [Cladorrhinum sp. PSN259]